jgi:type IX secretion system PorP/SprF family membrane protein
MSVIDDSGRGLNKLQNHFYLMGAYIYKINRKWTVEPGLLLKYVSPVQPQLDINAKATWQNLTWFALSYRTMDAVSIMGGYIFNKRIYIGYAYDYNVNPLRLYSFGSHELMLGYRFNNLK